MDSSGFISRIREKLPGFSAIAVSTDYPDEITLKVQPEDFHAVCLVLHKTLVSPVMTFFALDERQKHNKFIVNCFFVDMQRSQWINISMDLSSENPSFPSLSKSLYSANLFEREIWEMFGIEPQGNPDLRSLHLHEEIWPRGNYPLRKDFKLKAGELSEYKFARVEGEGVFEVPVGPVHAGIIGPGHFRFSAAGEPIVNLELRLGFTHRGVEKLIEGRTIADGLKIAECVSGDSSFAHSLAFCHAVEKISGTAIPKQAEYTRAILLELERMYNHVNDIGGIAVDVGFSFPAAFASLIKETLLQVNEHLTGSRYLKGVNRPAGVSLTLDDTKITLLRKTLEGIKKDFQELQKILYTNVTFMDRVDGAGVLTKKIAEDIGVIGLAGRASGISLDMRKSFAEIYKQAKINIISEQSGDVLARLTVRIKEFEESVRLIDVFLSKRVQGEKVCVQTMLKEGAALGYTEGWRGPVLYWLKINADGLIERCKITDSSFHNWQGLSYAVLGNIIPDFPLCNKSFDLSYTGNDL